jgi:hypothetical protein
VYARKINGGKPEFSGHPFNLCHNATRLRQGAQKRAPSGVHVNGHPFAVMNPFVKIASRAARFGNAVSASYEPSTSALFRINPRFCSASFRLLARKPALIGINRDKNLKYFLAEIRRYALQISPVLITDLWLSNEMNLSELVTHVCASA